jgi:hypothetical protein
MLTPGSKEEACTAEWTAEGWFWMSFVMVSWVLVLGAVVYAAVWHKEGIAIRAINPRAVRALPPLWSPLVRV